MATVILRTTAGAAHDHAVRNGNATVSPIAHILLLSGSAITNVIDILALTEIPGDVVHSFDRRSAEDCDWAITESTLTSTRIEAHLTESVTGITITGVVLTLENGVVWGYAPYLPDQGGLTKTIAFSWTLDLLIVESTDATPLQLTYSPIDYRSMRDRLITDIRNELNIEELLGMLQDATKFCLIDGNETSTWVLDGGEPDPLCQILPTTTTLPPIDGGIE